MAVFCGKRCNFQVSFANKPKTNGPGLLEKRKEMITIGKKKRNDPYTQVSFAKEQYRHRVLFQEFVISRKIG